MAALETKIGEIDAAIAAGQDPPEGPDWGGAGIVILPGGRREAYREHAILIEVTTPIGAGVYVLPHAASLSRFP